jgi:lysophospholipase L1-like esterase
MKKVVFILVCMITANLYSQKPVFLALGDSYTICEGLEENERWPNLITTRMAKNKMAVELAYNPSRTGYTTDHLIKHELPYLTKSKPDIVTILIGVNDYVRGYDTAHFHTNLSFILNEVQKNLQVKTNIILITIPDYSVTPAGKNYANGRDVTKDLQIWNAIIKKEADNRKLACVDIFPTTQKMKGDPSLVSSDELHPSAKEVALWADLIEPEFKKLVKQYY